MFRRSAIIHLFFAVCFLAAIVLSVVYILRPQWKQKAVLHERSKDLSTEMRAIREETAELEKRRSELESDNPDRLLKEARDKGLVPEGETVIKFLEEP